VAAETREPRPERGRRAAGAARMIAALVGALPVSLLGAIAVGRLAPLSAEARVALAAALAIPLWVLAACALVLAGRTTEARRRTDEGDP
jgi:hypothetical protein